MFIYLLHLTRKWNTLLFKFLYLKGGSCGHHSVGSRVSFFTHPFEKSLLIHLIPFNVRIEKLLCRPVFYYLYTLFSLLFSSLFILRFLAISL